MAHIYTALPEHYGELQLAKTLETFPDNKLHLWFSLNGIPGVTDIDILIWHEESGIFIVEVKAVTINMIYDYNWHNWICKDRGKEISPHRQALTAMHRFKNYIKSKSKPYNFYFSFTVAWPKISRSDWERQWGNKDLKKFSESMIFKEDIFHGKKVLAERLREIRCNPPSGQKSEYSFKHDENSFEKLKSIIEPDSEKQSIIYSDLERLRVLSDFHKRYAVSKVPPEDGHRVLFTGRPGTGKTFLILQIGLNHALNGRSVLFICFNKVLASDTVRLLSQSRELKIAKGLLDIYDAFQMLSIYFVDDKKDFFDRDPDEWATEIINNLKEGTESLSYYDTVLIDEAQDMKPWVFEMLEFVAKQSATWCVASGKGQELYGTESNWLKNFREKSIVHNLRRCFRNTKPVFQFAQAFYECAPNIDKINKSLDKFRSDSQKATQLNFVFDRIEGNTPSIIYINDQVDDIDPSDSFYAALQEEKIIAQYELILREQIKDLKNKEFPIDILVMVPSQKSKEKSHVIDAISKIMVSPPDNLREIDLIDYTNDINRRQIASRNQIRVCTYHSARGIEAHRVVLFGFEGIDRIVSEKTFNNLGYITLSRSLFDLTIAVSKSSNKKFVNFMEETLLEMQKIETRSPNIESNIFRESKTSEKENYFIDKNQFPDKVNDNKEIICLIERIIVDPKVTQRSKLKKLNDIKYDILNLHDFFIEVVKKEIKRRINSPKLKKERDLFISDLQTKR